MLEGKSDNVTTKEVSIDRTNEKRHCILSKCPDERSTSFEIRYAENWIKEDGRHFYRRLKLPVIPHQYFITHYQTFSKPYVFLQQCPCKQPPLIFHDSSHILHLSL